MHILPNTSGNESSRTIKLGQSIEGFQRNIFFQKSSSKVKSRQKSSRPRFIFQKSLRSGKSKWPATQFKHILTALNLAYKNRRCIKSQTIDPEICSMLTFWKTALVQFLDHILCIIFQEHFFPFGILLTDQISLTVYLYFLRYWAKCVLQFFVNHAMTS